MTQSSRGRDIVVAGVLSAAVVLVVVALALMHRPDDDPVSLAAGVAATDDELAHDARPPIDTGLDDPWAIAVGPDGRLWVAGDREVQVRAADGVLLARIPIEGRATCLAVDDRRLYVGVTDRVAVFDASDLSPLAMWPPLGEGTRLTSIALSGDGIWLADAGRARLGRFDAEGAFHGAIPADHDDPAAWATSGHFAVPSPYFDVALSQGNVVVANPGWHRVETWTAEGESVGSWGRQSSELAGFAGCCGPAQLAALGGGELVTVDKGLPRVKVYRADGSLRDVVATEERFAGHERACEGRSGGAIALDVAVDRRDRIVVLEPCTGRIRFLVPPGTGDGSHP